MTNTATPTTSTKPESGIAALLKAMGLSAVQVSSDVVALYTTPKKA